MVLKHTVDDQGMRLIVDPQVVLEVAFNNMMRSTRHESGYALRFPRILRIRSEKRPEDADTIEPPQGSSNARSEPVYFEASAHAHRPRASRTHERPRTRHVQTEWLCG